jgi:branched-chain amino acid transport system permease protein
MLTLWLNVIATGALMGVVYGLIALGATIIFGVVRISNFAHGEVVVIGAYLAFWAGTLLGVPTLASAALAAVLLFAFGYVLQRLVVQRFVERPHHLQFILFIGLALLITGLHLIFFGPDPRPAPVDLSFQVIELGPIRLDMPRVQAASAAAALIVALGAFLRYSTFGRCVRAVADNRLGGLVVGLNIPRIYAATFGIGLACAGAAGALVSPIFDVQPYLAVEFTLVAFVVVIVGGLGSFTGALVAGVIVGVSEAVAALLIAPSLKSAFAYALLILVLFFRPRGLFGHA